MRPVSVFVGGLGDDVSKEDLEREFGKYGPLCKVWVAQNPPGFAFLEFESIEDANEAIDAMNGTTINNSRIRVELSRNSNRGRRGGGEGGRGGFQGRGGGYRGGREGGFRGRGSSGYSRRDDSYGNGGSYRGSRDSGSYRYGGDQYESNDQFSSNYSGSSYGGMGDGNYKSSSYRSRSPVGSRSSNTW